MSEEEIIIQVKFSLEKINNYTSYRNETSIEKEHLQGLLDLYIKEKEKNRALEHLLELKRKRIKKLSELVEECGNDE